MCLRLFFLSTLDADWDIYFLLNVHGKSLDVEKGLIHHFFSSNKGHVLRPQSSLMNMSFIYRTPQYPSTTAALEPDVKGMALLNHTLSLCRILALLGR